MERVATVNASTASRPTGKLESLVLIGDSEQSIYSFQGASPEGCVALADARGLERMELTENHRSSQRICDVVVPFCGRDLPDHAVGLSADCPWEPKVVLYPADRPSQVLVWFENRLRELGITLERGAVLARANDWVREINSATRVDFAPRLCRFASPIVDQYPRGTRAAFETA